MNPLPGPHKTHIHITNASKDFIREELKEHKKNWDPSDPRDYIDCYLKEIQTVTWTICTSLLLTLCCSYSSSPLGCYEHDICLFCTWELSTVKKVALTWHFIVAPLWDPTWWKMSKGNITYGNAGNWLETQTRLCCWLWLRLSQSKFANKQLHLQPSCFTAWYSCLPFGSHGMEVERNGIQSSLSLNSGLTRDSSSLFFFSSLLCIFKK